MSKSKKPKNNKKASPLSGGMVVKGSAKNSFQKPSSSIPGKNFSSAKKGNAVSTPRKAGGS